MKSLKFLFVAVLAAFVFVSCEQPAKYYEGPIVINWGDAADVNGKTFEIGMANWEDEFQLVAHVELSNATSEAKTFTLKEVRNYDLADAFSAVCINQCMSSNGQNEQLWEIGTVEAGEVLGISLDLAPYVEEAKVFNSEFTFSDGTEEVKFVINYNFIPAE
jgi:hypothetical protein